MSDDDANLARLSDLLDKETIREVVHRLCRGADRGDRELVASCFHPDAVDLHRHNRGPAMEIYDRQVAAGMFLSMHHCIGQTTVALDGDLAHAESYCVLVYFDTDGASIRAVRYLDRFERRDAEWRIAERFVVYDGVGELVARDLESWAPQDSIGHPNRSDPLYQRLV